MEKQYDLIIYIGRFEPFHNEHKRVLDNSLSLAKNVLVVKGSCGGARTIKNPFTGDEVIEQMIRPCYTEEENKRIITAQAHDFIYDDQKWLKQIKGFIAYAMDELGLDENSKIALTGGAKSEWYFDLLTEFDRIVPELVKQVDATTIRDIWFRSVSNLYLSSDLNDLVPYPVKMFLITHREDKHFLNLRDEYFFVKKYKAAWENVPYPVTFVGCDACVVWRDQVLLIQRKNIPGKGLWAMPGGFLDQNESMVNCCVRELREETSISLPEFYLKSNITKTHLLDFPSRSERGRFISMAHRIDIEDHLSITVKASDDAANAEWKSIHWIKKNKDKFFNDHYDGLMILLGE